MRITPSDRCHVCQESLFLDAGADDFGGESASPRRWKNEKGWKSRTQIARIPSDS